jgi:DNA gyrase subunit A
MEVLKDDATVLTVSGTGYGKRTPVSEYRLQSRAGKGIITLKTGGRNGLVVAIRQVTDADDLLIVTDRGQLIRCPVSDIRVTGRNTMGVRLINLAEGEEVVAVEPFARDEDEEDAVDALEHDGLDMDPIDGEGHDESDGETDAPEEG